MATTPPSATMVGPASDPTPVVPISSSWRTRFVPSSSFAHHLENTGSVARDHLALERTFLAWLRTSLGLVSIGIAITQLFKLPQLNQEARLSALAAAAGLYYDGAGDSQSVFPARSHLRVSDIQKLGKPIGASFISLGLLVLLLGGYRFFSVQSQLIRANVFSPSRIEVSATALLTGALIVAALGVVLGTRIGIASVTQA